MNENIKISIIGADGYIGSNLKFHLEKNDYKNINLYGKGYKEIDITKINEVDEIDFDSDIIYILSGLTGTMDSFSKYENFINVNEIGLLNILNKYVEKKSKAKLIYPSSRLVYKGSRDKLSEDAKKEFKTIYSINKYAAEKYLEMYSNLYGVEYCIFRICLPYGNLVDSKISYGTMGFFIGNGEKGNNISIYGDGSQKRTLTHIEDICEIFLKGALNPDCVNDVYNIGGNDELSIKEIASLIAEIYGVKVTSKAWPTNDLLLESGSTVFDSGKIDLLFDFRYKNNFVDWAKEKIKEK